MPKQDSRQPWSATARLLVADTVKTIKANADTKLNLVVNYIEVVIQTPAAQTLTIQDESGVVIFGVFPASQAAGIYKFGPYKFGIPLPAGKDLRVTPGAAGIVAELKAEGYVDGATS